MNFEDIQTNKDVLDWLKEHPIFQGTFDRSLCISYTNKSKIKLEVEVTFHYKNTSYYEDILDILTNNYHSSVEESHSVILSVKGKTFEKALFKLAEYLYINFGDYSEKDSWISKLIPKYGENAEYMFEHYSSMEQRMIQDIECER